MNKNIVDNNSKYILFCLIMLSALFQDSYTNSRDSVIVNKPTVNELFSSLTIRLENSPSRVYAFTDKVGGFWEGQTFGYNGNGGYNINGQWLLKDFFLLKNGILLDRNQADQFEMIPHQSSNSWGENTKVTRTVLSGRKGMIVNVHNNIPVSWSFIPFFSTSSENLIIEKNNSANVFFIRDKSSNYILAIHSDTNWQPMQLPSDLELPFPENFGLDNTLDQQLITEKIREANIVLLFGTDKSELEAQIVEIAKSPSAFISERKEKIGELLLRSYFETNLPEYDKALHWAKITGNELVVSQFGTGIWAGLPWFNQSWGRDTFIALPGISLVTGQFEDAAEIIKSFADFQIKERDNALYGRVPNRVNSPTDIIYNTTDGTPWLIREIAEYVFFTGDTSFARELFPVLKRAIEGAQKYFVDDLGFLTHDDADTWMDARIEGKQAWSPRGNRAVEIQVLWYNQLKVSSYLAQKLGFQSDAKKWEQMAEKVKNRFNQYFYDLNENALFDHLNMDGSVDRQIRPNQMFAITIPMLGELIEQNKQAGIVKQVVSELTYPYGVTSLSQNDPYFHPFHHDQIYHFDAAYHNGMCWQWIAGPVIGGMVRLGYENLAFELTQNLTDQILTMGMPGSMSELVEPAPKDDGSLQLTGTYSQAWSVSEFIRNFYQDYLGLNANMIEGELQFTPRLPNALTNVKFNFNIGQDEQIEGFIQKRNDSVLYKFNGQGLLSTLKIKLEIMDTENNIYVTSFKLKPNQAVRFEITDPVNMKGELNGREISLNKKGIRLPDRSETLDFQKFKLNPALQTIKVPNYLEKIRLSSEQVQAR